MGSTRKIFGGVLWSITVNIVNAIYGFIAVPILIAHFGKSEYGLIGLAMSINVYMQLMDMGFNSTNVRFFSVWLTQKNIERLKIGFQTSLSFYSALGFINAIILLGISLFSDKIFNISSEQNVILKNLFYILSLSAFCNWFSSCFDQLIKATENISWIQKRTLVTKFLMIVILVITVIGNLSIELYYALTCMASFIIVPLSIKKIKNEIPDISFLPSWNRSAFKEMLPYCMNIFSFSIFQFSFYNLRPVFLGIQGTIESVADYRILNGIIGIVTMLGGAFIGVLLPSTSKIIANNDMKSYYRIAYDGTKYVSIMISFCCFGMMTIGKEVITLYVGDSYLYLIPWFNIWLLSTLGSHNQAISSLILAGDDIRVISYSSAFASILGLISAWFLIPFYQIGGVCIAFAIYTIIQIGFYYFYYWPIKMNINSKSVFFRSFLFYVILGYLLYYIISNFLYVDIESDIFSLFLKGITFTILYVMGVWCLLKKDDKTFIISILKRK